MTNATERGEAAIKAVREMAARFQAAKDQVEKECVSMADVARLMKKHGETRPGDAIGAEARDRMKRGA
jgi:uncharacterized protein with GYD domain